MTGKVRLSHLVLAAGSVLCIPGPAAASEPSQTAPNTAGSTAPTLPPAREILLRSRELARASATEQITTATCAQRFKAKHISRKTRRPRDAAYLRAWARKVQSIGNANYPAEARRRGLAGELLLEACLNRDGTLVDVRILRSSGHPMLDSAAIDIVRLAAPFDLVTDDVMEDYEVLRITRSWRFAVE